MVLHNEIENNKKPSCVIGDLPRKNMAAAPQENFPAIVIKSCAITLH